MILHLGCASVCGGSDAHCRQAVQFMLRGHIGIGEFFEVRQPGGQYVNLSVIFGGRLRQRANDWLVGAFLV